MTTSAIWGPATGQGPGEAAPCSVAALAAWPAWGDGTCQLDGLSSRWAIAHGDPRLAAIAHQRAAKDNPA